MENESLVPHRHDGRQVLETRTERLSREFYRWERRGRGWHVAPYPCELEPPYRPFYLVEQASNYPAIDDGRQPSLWDQIKSGLSRGKKAAGQNLLQHSAVDNDPDDLDPDYCGYGQDDFVEFQLALPHEQKITPSVSESLLLAFGCLAAPVSFEVVGTGERVAVQFAAAAERDAAQVNNQLCAHLPQAVIAENRRTLREAWNEGQGAAMIVDFGLAREFMLPLRTVSSFETDPLVAITGALSHLRGGETGVLQILFQPVRMNWAEAMLDAVRNPDGTAFFANAPEVIPLTKEKISRPLFAAVIRVAARSATSARALQIARNIAGAFAQLSNPIGNELIPLSNNNYHPIDHELALLDRHTHRAGMILNSAELVSLVHPPSAAVQSEKLVRDAHETKPPPKISIGHRLVLGINEHNGAVREVTISSEQRTRHLYLLGASGSGKSNLLLNLIRQDMERGDGLCLLDPHGDLVDEAIARVPADRIEDVILFDPSDSEYPIGFNVLQANSESEKTLIASDLVAIFRRFSTSWGDVMDAVLANAVLAALENTRGGTLFDLKRLLVEKDFRQEYLKTVRDEAVRYFWQYEYGALAGRSQSSVLVRLDTFLRQKLVRNIVCQQNSRLNFRQVMDNRKILLVKLSGGLVGAENAALLGTLIVSKLQQIALSRQDTESSRRPYFWLYLDEFHHFVSPSMEALLSGVRKYKIGLHLAHQEFRQLQARDLEVAQSVLSNCATRACFRLGDADAERFAAGFSFFDKNHLQNLGTGEAIARIERAEFDFNLRTEKAVQVSSEAARRNREEIVRLSRARYAAPRVEVEAALQALRPVPTAQTSAEEEEENNLETNRLTVPANDFGQTKPKAKKALDSQKACAKSDAVQAESKAAADAISQQHRYLQETVKRIGEKRGFMATVEKEVLGGVGKIDVALERDEQRIACEISVTNRADYELSNLRKCLAAGYHKVVMLSADAGHLREIERTAQKNLPLDEFDRIAFLSPGEFDRFLKNATEYAPEENGKIKGYRVAVDYAAPGDEAEGKSRVRRIGDTILNIVRRRTKSSE
jgi:hypothetical protein